MTSDRDSFLTAICESPADDLPRLVYADWLEENGEADRAEFIRVQCALAKMEPRIVVTEPCVCEQRYGPNYYTLTGGEETLNGRLVFEAQVGKRVDILHARSATKKTRPMWGLRISKVDGDSEIVLVKDELSVPSAYAALQARERELIGVFGYDWCPETIRPYNGQYSRGFISSVTLPRSALSHLPAILATQPIELVKVEGAEFEIRKHSLGDWFCRQVFRGGFTFAPLPSKTWPTRSALVAGIGEWIESVLPSTYERFRDEMINVPHRLLGT